MRIFCFCLSLPFPNPWGLHRPPELLPDRHRWRDFAVRAGGNVFSGTSSISIVGLLFGVPSPTSGTLHILQAFLYPPPAEAPDARLAARHTVHVRTSICFWYQRNIVIF